MRKMVLLLAFLLPLTASVATGNYDFATARWWVPDLWVENSTFTIKVRINTFSGGMPAPTTVPVHIQILHEGKNVFNSTYNINTFETSILQITTLPRGYYTLIASTVGKTYAFDFAVLPPPHPYSASFSPSGSLFFFDSLDNSSFRLVFKLAEVGGNAETVAIYDNVKHLNMTIPASWKRGILTVWIWDEWGWQNGMSIDLSSMKIVGEPLIYDYAANKVPPGRWLTPTRAVVAAVTFVFSVLLLRRWW